MRRLFNRFGSCSVRFPQTFAADAVKGRLIKTLPLFLDLKGRDSLSPSLYDRDAYQVYLRQHPEERSASASMYCGRAKNHRPPNSKCALKLRGISTNSLPSQTTLEQETQPKFFRRWTSVKI